MDTPVSASFSSSRDPSRRPSYTCASSRSSTSAASDFRSSAQTSERSVSSLTPSPQPPLKPQEHATQTQPTSHLVHRFQHASAMRGSPAPSTSTDSSRFRSSLNDDPRPSDSKPSLTATSSYLQEKLLKERRVEGDRCSSRLSNDKTPSAAMSASMSSSMDVRAIQSSPARPPFDISRPKSSTGHLDGKKKGVGLKEMEQTLSTLHKQNFDLKLELYHRREKQTALEERCEGLETKNRELEEANDSLETKKRELEDINDNLEAQLDMRGKAVEEAVAMIVSLEARLEDLLMERQRMQQAEKDRFFADARFGSQSSFDDTPKATKIDDAHTIHRMPSFMSERSELTENLRNVYLGSLVSLPRMSEDTLDGDLRDAAFRIASPSLSVLSESSFISIYGKKEAAPAQQAPLSTRPLSPVACVPDIPRSLPDGSGRPARHANANANVQARAPTAPPPAEASLTPTKKRSSSISGVNVPIKAGSSSSSGKHNHAHSGSDSLNTNLNALATFNALNDFLGTNSPLQRLEKMEMSLQAMNDASRPGSQEDRGEIYALARLLRQHDIGSNAQAAQAAQTAQASQSKQQKKDALRRVRTDAPFSRDMAMNGQHNLPPTPDTISTSTLRRYKNSNDTLLLDKDASSNEQSYLTLSEESTSRSGPGGQGGQGGEKRVSAVESFVDSNPRATSGQPASTTAFNSRLPEFGGGRGSGVAGFDDQMYVPPRPRSADASTIAHSHSGGWGESDSSDDDMDIDGNDSASLHDYWLRESLRPAGQAPATTKNKGRRSGRISPDLFSFPTTSNGWATTAMFGSLGGQGYRGSGPGYQGSAPLALTLDALSDSLPAPAAGLFGPSGLLASPLPYEMGGSGMPSGPPPPPHRRSSLHAQTGHGSTSSRSGSRHGSRHGGTAPGTPSLGTPSVFSGKSSRRSPTRPPARPATTTGIKGDAAGVARASGPTKPPPAAPAAPAPAQDQVTLPKQRHYPPASGANTTSRSRVMSLFRRSGSHETNTVAQTPAVSSSAGGAPVSAPPTETTFAAAAAATAAKSAKSVTPAMGMPSRVRRGELDDEVGGVPISSTPPPILRNPRNPGLGNTEAGGGARLTGDGEEAKEDDVQPTEPAPAPAPAPVPAPVPAQDGGRKKWLGLGRVTSLRNRAG